MGTKQRVSNEATADMATGFVSTFHFPVSGARYPFPVSRSHFYSNILYKAINLRSI